MLTIATGAGCRNRNKGTDSLAELVPPKGAPAWESRYAVAFDDSYTPTSINLEGRAPNDVLDQQLFQARLGHAAVVVLVRIEQVWGKGRYQGRQDQFVELQVGEVLMGSLPKEAPERLMIEVQSIDELPGELRDEIMIFFLRWDDESEPPYHHHLMPADEELVSLIKAMVKHAQNEGVLDAKGSEKRGGRGKRGKGKRGKSKRGGQGGPNDPIDDSGVAPGTPIQGGAAPSELDNLGGNEPGGGLAPDEPPPPDGPQPDASTGLQDLGKKPDPAESAPEEALPE